MAVPNGIEIQWNGQQWFAYLYDGWQPLNLNADQIATGIASGAYVLGGTQSAPDVAAHLAARNVPLARAQPLGLRPQTVAEGTQPAQPITAPQPQGQAGATPFGQRQADGTILAPDGTMLSPAGAIISRGPPAAPSAPVAATAITAPQPQAAAAPAQPTPGQGNNPDAVFNPATGTWNIDPAVQRARQVRAAPAASTANTEPVTVPLGVDLAYDDPLLRAEWERLAAPQPLGVGGVRLPQFAGGGMTRYQTGGMTPNAVIGEGMEDEGTQFDKPQRTELVLVPTGRPNNFDVYYAEGPAAVTLKPSTEIIPVAGHLEEMVKARHLPVDQMQQPKDGEGGGDLAAYRGGGLVPARSPSLPALPAVYGDGGRLGAA